MELSRTLLAAPLPLKKGKGSNHPLAPLPPSSGIAVSYILKQLDTWLRGTILSLNIATTHPFLFPPKNNCNTLSSRNENVE